ncbi:hypothetical protein EDB80DRAFT_675897 [Ilyonectria destructans]|nr:hypothetical protein EDB80DRAFT_675897 [Ilyonectria destructans]
MDNNLTKLVVLPYLQSWDGSHLSFRVLLVPRGDPFAPLIPSQGPTDPVSPSFVTANLKLDVHLLSGHESLPQLSSGAVITTLDFNSTPNSAAILNGLVAQLGDAGLSIDPNPPDARSSGSSPIRVHKHLPLSYQQSVGFVPGGELFHTDKTYWCSLNDTNTPSKYVPLPPKNLKVAWGRMIAALLRNPKLAEAAGLIRSAMIPISLETVKDGGYIFLTISTTSDAAALSLKTYAARIPIVTTARDLFTPVFFPTSSTLPSDNYGQITAEAEEYDDGWAKAVHCTQPRQLDPLKEEDDGTRPLKEMGIRIGWDDEQVTIWMDRQMDPSSINLDTPLGVQGYRIDTQDSQTSTWHSLVVAEGPCIVNRVSYGQYDGVKDELGVEVHPTQQIGSEQKDRFWLPMYFTTWSGPSLVTADKDRMTLLSAPDKTSAARVKGVAPTIALTYGMTYKFRVRLRDHSGAGPTIGGAPRNIGLSPISTVPFRRWIRPLAPIFVDAIPVLLDTPGSESFPASLEVKRPVLHYPAAVCTGYPNAMQRLLDSLAAENGKPREDRQEPSMADPDVDRLEIQVEIETLTQDVIAVDGTYMVLYTTTRQMPSDIGDSGVVEFSWHSVHNVFEPVELADGWGADATTGPIKLPTARTIRLRVGALCKEDPELAYFGNNDVRRGPTIIVALRKNSTAETDLLLEESPSKAFNAYFLQPDRLDSSTVEAARKPDESPADITSRLATAIGVRNSGMTLRSAPGERTVFACSGSIRHTIGPDGASLSFTSQADLALYWIIVIRLALNRDWTWSGLAYNGIFVERDGKEVTRFSPSHNVNADALADPKPNRGKTDLIIFDAIDPKTNGNSSQELTPSYKITTTLVGTPTSVIPSKEYTIRLPITTPPRHTPTVVSAGIAMSSYSPNSDYSTTLPRDKTLWLEFSSPIMDPRTTYYCRVLRNTPDPLLIEPFPITPTATEPTLPVDNPATLRVVRDQSNDHAGLTAMQQLAPSTSDPIASTVHYSVPLPPGLTPMSPELFGFFTYEFRVGYSDPDTWCTASSRYGTPLRVSGIQHPLPQLTCTAARNAKAIIVSAPFAMPILDGVPKFPAQSRPTRMIILLYAQVYQIDSSSQRRNVLLAQKEATARTRFDHDAPPGRFRPTTYLSTYAAVGFDFDGDGGIWHRLEGLGLARTTPLSVLAVEMAPFGGNSGVHLEEPLGRDLGRQRILRTGILVRVPGSC